MVPCEPLCRLVLQMGPCCSSLLPLPPSLCQAGPFSIPFMHPEPSPGRAVTHGEWRSGGEAQSMTPSRQAGFSFHLFPFLSEVTPTPPPRAEEGGWDLRGAGKVSRFLPLPKCYQSWIPSTILHLCLAGLTIFKNYVQKKLWAEFQFRLPCLRVSSSLWTSVFPSLKWNPGEGVL